MYYYEVIPADRSYHGQDSLTYQHDDELNTGQLVVVKVRTKSCVGIVIKNIPKPEFKTKAIDRVLDQLSLPQSSIELLGWVRSYYPAPLGLTAAMFVPQALQTKKLPTPPKSSSTKITSSLPPLTLDQTKALKILHTQKSGTTMLHGDTGTGKTRIYIELTQKTIQSGQSVIILTPEISLTPQLVASFKNVFSEVLVTHSQQTAVARRNLWSRLAISNKPVVLIGPRSALFMPISNLGLIVIDEFHESAYKNEQAPHYHAIRVASKLASLQQSKLILGSGTPPINEYYYATQKNIPVVRMQQLAAGSSHPPTKTDIVDLTKKEELGSMALISKTLLSHIDRALANKEQILLFLNKRGSARLLVCQSCGWKALCNQCDLPMVYHQDKHILRCHTCGTKEPSPNNCPVCGSSEIIFKSPGTKTIVANLQKRFPDAQIARFDKDNTADERMDKRLEEVQSGDVDILVGTQLLAKGHDLPKLALVGILLADSELSFPDYAAQERSYQLIHQLSGRVGRGHRPGTVVVQTYNPANIAAITGHENTWQNFYDQQLDERKAFGFPPYYFTLKIETARATSASAEQASQQILNHIYENYSGIELVGPSPSFFAKRSNKFSWQLIVKAKNRQLLVDIASSLPVRATFDIDPLHLL